MEERVVLKSMVRGAFIKRSEDLEMKYGPNIAKYWVLLTYVSILSLLSASDLLTTTASVQKGHAQFKK
jgi:hypothetical protein